MDLKKGSILRATSSLGNSGGWSVKITRNKIYRALEVDNVRDTLTFRDDRKEITKVSFHFVSAYFDLADQETWGMGDNVEHINYPEELGPGRVLAMGPDVYCTVKWLKRPPVGFNGGVNPALMLKKEVVKSPSDHKCSICKSQFYETFSDCISSLGYYKCPF